MFETREDDEAQVKDAIAVSVADSAREEISQERILVVVCVGAVGWDMRRAWLVLAAAEVVDA